MPLYLSTTVEIDFGALSTHETKGESIELMGAMIGDVVAWGAPVTLDGIMFNSYVSAENEVTIRVANISHLEIDLPTLTFKVIIIR